MKELVPLINLIVRKKISDKYILKSSGDTNKQDKLYLLIKNNKVQTDEEAINILYDNGSNKHAYLRMKRRLKEKLYNSLTTLDQNKQKYTTRKKGHYKIMKLFIVANFLGLEGEHTLRVHLLEDLIRRAIKYELTEFVRLISSQLVRHYSVRTKDDKKYRRFLKIYHKYVDIEEYEFKATIYLTELTNLYHQKGSKKQTFLERLKLYSDELTPLQKNIDSFEFNHRAYTIRSTRFIFEGKYLETINNADQALAFFKKKPFESIRDRFSFNSDKIIALILLGRFNEAEDLIQITQETAVRKKAVNYFNLQYYKFLIFSLDKRYAELPNLVDEVINTKEIKQYNRILEIWRIRQAYTYFLLESGLVSRSSDSLSNYKPFKLAKFINEVPIYSKEKRGVNVSILVVQLLFFIVRKKYNIVIDRIDALKQYSFRYLRNDDTFRSNCFIKMLIKIPEANFHPVRTELHSRKLFEKLLNHQVDVQYITNDIEVIPFHDLWLLILSILKNDS